MNVQQEDMACQKKLEKVLKFKQEIINPRCIIVYQKSNPSGLNLEFKMSVLSDLGGCWDVFFLPEVIA